MTRSTRRESSEASAKGYVYIIGAGPGDPDLLTMKADKALQEADVILYDDLVSSDLIARYSGEKIYTGKRKDSHHFEQEAINEEIVRHALLGKTVARLKGGDPFIFGRGGEEIEVLRRDNINYEIIPGITAAHGASAYTEIPLTMRKVSSSVAFCTGHPVNKIQVPDTDTIVYYMVASSVHDVLEAVLKKGRSSETKVAVVQNATRYNQKSFTGTIGEFMKREKSVYSPALLIIGDNINQFIEKSWFSRKKKVLLTGGDSRRYSTREYVKVNFACRRLDSADSGMVKQCLDDLDTFSILFFSNRFAVRYFFRYLLESRRDARHLAHMKIVTVAKTAASELEKYGVIADHTFDTESPEIFREELRENGVNGSTILFPGSNHVDEFLVGELQSCSNRVTTLSVYAHGEQEQEDLVDLEFIDEIYFASPMCVRNFRKLYRTIPERVTVSTANKRTEDEYHRQFAG